MFLKSMHDDNIVHGDIRALNIIFSGDETVLIDHDFGGVVNEVTFPPGYATSLPDGSRAAAEAMKPITKERDVIVLWRMF